MLTVTLKKMLFVSSNLFSWLRIMPKAYKKQVKIVQIITMWVLVARHGLIFGVNEAHRHWDAF